MNLQLSIRTKLTLGFLIVIITGGFIFSYFGSKTIGNILIKQVQGKVYHDLETARMIYNEKLGDIRDIVKFTSKREGIIEAVVKNDRTKLLKYLTRVKKDCNFDILTLTDENGKVIVRVNNPKNIGDSRSEDPLVKKSLNKEIIASTEIISKDELLKESGLLAQKVFMQIIPTPKAEPSKENENINGMILKASAPIIDERNIVKGVIYGGMLLNRNYEIVDKVKNVVYKGEKYKGKDTGTATIFQGDLRVSTNVINEKGERAIATRVAADVSKSVLIQGKTWMDRAFVVKDWYITAYEPIKNIKNEIIGMLYVGTLEVPYVNLRNRIQFVFFGITLLTAVVLSIIAFLFTGNIIKPLMSMAFATDKIAKGELNHYIDVKSKDEIGRLAESFNQMTTALQKAKDELIEWGNTLEEKVKDKTKELELTQIQLVQSEKLATIGQLAAGVAHELNNPLGGIIVYSHLLLEKTNITGIDKENLEKIVREATRCKNIVKGLLDFSRQTKPELILANTNDILNNALSLIEKQVLFQNIEVIKKFETGLPMISIDVFQIQQVFMNVIVNAAEAMNGKGRLNIETGLSENNQYIEIKFMDTGYGIEPENIKKIFEPFFTTKEVGKGTGLGLAISYGIIKRHKGDIVVQSEIGKGTKFTVRLPVTLREE